MEGVKNTVNVQVPAGASDPPQGASLPLALKSLPRMPPLMVAAVRVTVVEPTLVMVTAPETGIPTATIPKLTTDGLNLIKVPIPAKSTVCGLVASRFVTVTVPAA